MKLILRGSPEYLTTEFGQWLLPIVQLELLSALNHQNLTNWNKYINKSELLVDKKDINIKDLVVTVIANISCEGIDGELTIAPSYIKQTPKLKNIRQDTFARLFNFGNLSVKGCNIFTETFNKVLTNVNSYLCEYYQL